MLVKISESNYCGLYLTFWPAQLKTGDVQDFWQSLGALILLAQSTSLLASVSQRPELSALLFTLNKNVCDWIPLCLCPMAVKKIS